MGPGDRRIKTGGPGVAVGPPSTFALQGDDTPGAERRHHLVAYDSVVLDVDIEYEL